MSVINDPLKPNVNCYLAALVAILTALFGEPAEAHENIQQEPLVQAALELKPAETEKSGEAIFKQTCASCHSLEYKSNRDLLTLWDKKGPSLVSAGSKYRDEWLQGWLQDPVAIRPAGYLAYRRTLVGDDGDRISTAFKDKHLAVDESEARLLTDFLVTQQLPLNPYPAFNGSPVIKGGIHFNKILGCGSCHRVGDKGGVTGPGFNSASSRYQAQWLTSYMQDPYYWDTVPMPKLRVRSDQLVAMTDYLMLDRESELTEVDSTMQVNIREKLYRDKPPQDVTDIEGRAEKIYQIACSQCHGISGDGLGLNSSFLAQEPRNHTSAKEMEKLSNEHLFKVIKFGGVSVDKSTLMPAWGALIKDQDIEALVVYLRQLSNTENPKGRR
ncbi:c-type cytochrome [Shewanella sp. D64]|uniref:c-type cytochrome n=1 Tax=unclassified Shewanella TaxID=196818 RepID=UPI0022BA41B2|nr:MULTISPECIES: cytochrome c [unclassified Shewanella]MEC4725329.1 c-type cytochrome [Shewanella sp. D64]MEC4735825.1 c-type cytochrome [Shewanella sp. E94]WBJ93204.1 c-type cytochrome [Shewanella sp. MTB7]